MNYNTRGTVYLNELKYRTLFITELECEEEEGEKEVRGKHAPRDGQAELAWVGGLLKYGIPANSISSELSENSKINTNRFLNSSIPYCIRNFQ